MTDREDAVAGLDVLLRRVPRGWSRVVVGGRPYGVARTDHADGRSISIHAEELGGPDVVSTNVWRTAAGDLLRPCEMPAQKVLAFLRALPPGSADDAAGPSSAPVPRHDDDGNPVGTPVPGWAPRAWPGGVTLVGRTVAVEPLADRHLQDLHSALDVTSPASLWAYYPAGPFLDAAALGAWLAGRTADPATAAYALCDTGGTARGAACYLRIDPPNGSVEVGNILLSESMQRTTAATEAMYLLMRHVFDDLGYRRYEWKCDSLNGPSRRAAGRLGFSYEGTFRQAVVYRGRNRDTAWYSITDDEWPGLRDELERWLDPANFADGVQRTRLDVITALGRMPERAPADRGRGGMTA